MKKAKLIKLTNEEWKIVEINAIKSRIGMLDKDGKLKPNIMGYIRSRIL